MAGKLGRNSTLQEKQKKNQSKRHKHNNLKS